MAGRWRRVAASTAVLSGAAVAYVRTVLHPKRDDAAMRLLRATTIDASTLGDTGGRDAILAVQDHGFATLVGLLPSLDPQLQRHLPESIDISSVAATAGAAAAALLPTVHQADAMYRQSRGAQLGELAVASIFASLGTDSLIGYAQAVAKLERHATLDAAVELPGSTTSRALVLQLAVPSSPTWQATEDAAGVGSLLDSVSAGASILRAWANVLLAAAGRWDAVLDASFKTTGFALSQPKVSLATPVAVVSAPSPVEFASLQQAESGLRSSIPTGVRASGAWTVNRWLTHASRQLFGSGAELTVLLPLPMPPPSNWPAPASVLVEMLLPVEHAPGSKHGRHHIGGEPVTAVPELTAVRVRVRVGSALLIDSRARWRLVDEEQAPPAVLRAACVLYEYDCAEHSCSTVLDGQPAGGRGSGDLLSLMGQAAIAIMMGSAPVVLDPALQSSF